MSTMLNRQHSILSSWKIPSSVILIWELPFWCVLLYGSLVPATMVGREEWFGVPMKSSDLITLLTALIYGTAAFINLAVRGRMQVTKWLLLSTISLFIYGLLRLFNTSLEREDQFAMAFALLLAASAPIQAAGILSNYDALQTRAFVNRLVLFLALVSLIYTAESVFGLGLRSEESQRLGTDFGMQRVRGPLYGPSTGYLLLLPAIGWALQSFFNAGTNRAYAVFTTVCLLSAFLGLGSRAGLIVLVLYLISLSTLARQMKRRELTALLLAAFSVGVGFLIYSQADTQRLTKFEDTHRQLTHETAWNILRSEESVSLIAGQGYGSIWPWYRRDTLRAEWVALGDNTVTTGYGASLYHSHSTLLELAVEFGLIGLAWLAYLSARIAKLAFLPQCGTAWKVFTLSLVISLFSLGFDLFLFKEVRVNSVWWLFVFAAFQMRPQAGTTIS